MLRKSAILQERAYRLSNVYAALEVHSAEEL